MPPQPQCSKNNSPVGENSITVHGPHPAEPLNSLRGKGRKKLPNAATFFCFGPRHPTSTKSNLPSHALGCLELGKAGFAPNSCSFPPKSTLQGAGSTYSWKSQQKNRILRSSQGILRAGEEQVGNARTAGRQQLNTVLQFLPKASSSSSVAPSEGDDTPKAFCSPLVLFAVLPFSFSSKLHPRSP